jgi:glycosyltransferase involved in cell wall biosynthesis
MTAPDDPRIGVSVVIPVRNGADVFAPQLEALAAQQSPVLFEVLVADNGSTDGTRELALSFVDRIPLLRVVDASRAPGINVARNEGARAARGELLLFCDADDLVQPGWISAMWAASRTAPALGGALDERSLNVGNRYGRDDDKGDHFTSTGLPVGLRFLPFPVGANSGVLRQVYLDVGGFDESYAGGGDEVDFFWRVQLAGHALAFVPDGVVAYRHRVGARDNAKQMYRYGIAKVQLYSRYRSRGAPRDRVIDAIRALAGIFLRLPDLFNPAQRVAYASRVATLAGQVRGSVRYRTLHLAR